MKTTLDRRRFLALGAALVFARPTLAATPERALVLRNLHTEETLHTVYWADGQYLADPLARIDHLLRDHRSGEVAVMAPRLLDLLFDLNRVLDSTAPIEIISGYRAPSSNALLAAQSDGVAKSSLHTRGMAVDLRVPGRELARVRQAALDLRAGGVGFYPGSGFVHVDVGRVRSWG